MKKISFLLAVLMSFTMLAACGKNENSKDDSSASTTSSNDSISGSDNGTSASDDTEKTEPEQMSEVSKIRYGYNSLSDDEKDIYARILSAVNNFESSVTFEKEITFETYKKIFGLVYFQEPQLFWFKGSYEIFDQPVTSTSLEYRCTEDEAKTKRAELDSKVNEITASFPQNATVVDKLKVLHDYVIKHCTFTKEGTFVQTVYGALIEGKIQCEGYAKAMGYLCDKTGIENIMIVGTNNLNASHAWNLVKVDGEWYNIDLTWDDPADKTDLNYVRYNYFNVTDAEILNKTHFQDLSYFTPPAATATKANFQINYGLYAENYDDALKLIKEDLLKASSEKRREIQIKVSSKAVLDELNQKLVEKAGIFDILKESNNTATTKFKEGTVVPAKDDNVLTMQFVVEYQ